MVATLHHKAGQFVILLYDVLWSREHVDPVSGKMESR